MATTITVLNENVGYKSRVTKDGRQLTYKLSVIQQPERARACGQGAKASSDRRPVDPPPIVELHIYEGQDGQQQDITFTHNANFFLFATLENARTIAQGRVSAAQQATSQPVLTGTPVAGISYLDRPTPAGYFIFPDLSVRHEGKYRLAFTLLEQMKHEKDVGVDATEASLSQDKGVSSYVHGRCEVRSTPFTVYSAKKFPGLAESTALSRTVADQGCRVRIRRDVRMRRRESKPGKDWDDYEDETAADRARATPTPDATPRSQHPSSAIEPMERPPSASNISNASFHPPSSRRTSVHDMQAPFQAPPQSIPPPPQHFSQSEPSIPPPPPYPNHMPGYDHPYPQPQQFMAQAPSGPPQYPPAAYGYPQQVPQYGYPQPQAPVYDHGHPMNYAPQPQVPAFQPAQYQPQSSPIVPQNFQSQQPTPSSATSQLPPLKAFDESRPKMEPTSPHGMTEVARPTVYDFGPNPAPPPQYVTANTGPPPKRAYGAVFNTQHINQPLRSGARPDGFMTQSPHDSSEYSDEDIDMENFKMTYRRANGETIARDWPQYS